MACERGVPPRCIELTGNGESARPSKSNQMTEGACAYGLGSRLNSRAMPAHSRQSTKPQANPHMSSSTSAVIPARPGTKRCMVSSMLGTAHQIPPSTSAETTGAEVAGLANVVVEERRVVKHVDDAGMLGQEPRYGRKVLSNKPHACLLHNLEHKGALHARLRARNKRMAPDHADPGCKKPPRDQLRHEARAIVMVSTQANSPIIKPDTV